MKLSYFHSLRLNTMKYPLALFYGSASFVLKWAYWKNTVRSDDMSFSNVPWNATYVKMKTHTLKAISVSRHIGLWITSNILQGSNFFVSAFFKMPPNFTKLTIYLNIKPDFWQEVYPVGLCFPSWTLDQKRPRQPSRTLKRGLRRRSIAFAAPKSGTSERESHSYEPRSFALELCGKLISCVHLWSTISLAKKTLINFVSQSTLWPLPDYSNISLLRW